MDLTTFRARFPEFSRAGDAYVQGFLTSATARVDEDAFGETLATEAIGWLAAHLMAVTPAGITAGMSTRGDSPYMRQYERICREALGGPQVI